MSRIFRFVIIFTIATLINPTALQQNSGNTLALEKLWINTVAIMMNWAPLVDNIFALRYRPDLRKFPALASEWKNVDEIFDFFRGVLSRDGLLVNEVMFIMQNIRDLLSDLQSTIHHSEVSLPKIVEQYSDILKLIEANIKKISELMEQKTELDINLENEKYSSLFQFSNTIYSGALVEKLLRADELKNITKEIEKKIKEANEYYPSQRKVTQSQLQMLLVNKTSLEYKLEQIKITKEGIFKSMESLKAKLQQLYNENHNREQTANGDITARIAKLKEELSTDIIDMELSKNNKLKEFAAKFDEACDRLLREKDNLLDVLLEKAVQSDPRSLLERGWDYFTGVGNDIYDYQSKIDKIDASLKILEQQRDQESSRINTEYQNLEKKRQEQFKYESNQTSHSGRSSLDLNEERIQKSKVEIEEKRQELTMAQTEELNVQLSFQLLNKSIADAEKTFKAEEEAHNRTIATHQQKKNEYEREIKEIEEEIRKNLNASGLETFNHMVTLSHEISNITTQIQILRRMFTELRQYYTAATETLKAKIGLMLKQTKLELDKPYYMKLTPEEVKAFVQKVWVKGKDAETFEAYNYDGSLCSQKIIKQLKFDDRVHQFQWENFCKMMKSKIADNHKRKEFSRALQDIIAPLRVNGTIPSLTGPNNPASGLVSNTTDRASLEL